MPVAGCMRKQFEYDEEADLIRHYNTENQEIGSHQPSACERYFLLQIHSLEYRLHKQKP
jgi:hypothetical protein